MEQKPKHTTRRKFVYWGLGIASSLTALQFLFSKKKNSSPVKMLTQDGKLVEVDTSRIRKTGIKISDKEVITWVKNKPTF